MLSAHASLAEEAEEWTRRKFTTCQVSQITFSPAGEEVPPRGDSSGDCSTKPEVQEHPQQNQQADVHDNKEESSLSANEKQEEQLENHSEEFNHLGIVRQVSGPKKSRVFEKRVSFPSDESQLVKNLEPPSFDIPGKLVLIIPFDKC